MVVGVGAQAVDAEGGADDAVLVHRQMAASRVVPSEIEQTFTIVLPMPLEQLFTRWYGPIPPIRSTEGPDPWGTPGQRRRVNLVGPGRMTETLTEVEPPHHFSYRLDHVRGPMSVLVAQVDGRWSFTSTGVGTEVTWSWSVAPRTGMQWLLPTLERLWQGYAKRVLLNLDRLLRDAGSLG